MIFKTTSTKAALIANGMSAHILNPWHLTIDTETETITVSKRNPFLIGIDQNVIAFRFIRQISIDEHLIGADLKIHVTGGTAEVKFISKDDAQKIKNLLMEYNAQKNGSIIFG